MNARLFGCLAVLKLVVDGQFSPSIIDAASASDFGSNCSRSSTLGASSKLRLVSILAEVKGE
jgi:hypothetical protein